MITLWYSKVKNKFKDKDGKVATLSDVPDRYYDDVLARLVAEGLYDENGNEITS